MPVARGVYGLLRVCILARISSRGFCSHLRAIAWTTSKLNVWLCSSCLSCARNSSTYWRITWSASVPSGGKARLLFRRDRRHISRLHSSTVLARKMPPITIGNAVVTRSERRYVSLSSLPSSNVYPKKLRSKIRQVRFRTSLSVCLRTFRRGIFICHLFQVSSKPRGGWCDRLENSKNSAGNQERVLVE